MTFHKPLAGWIIQLAAVFFLLLGSLFLQGCVPASRAPGIKGMPSSAAADRILSATRRQPVSFQQMIGDLQKVKVVYIGERHTNRRHHRIQLRILKALYRSHPRLSVGMEMFDTTYQPVLDRWSKGELDRQTFLRLTHWYANWKFDYKLYADILDFIKARHIPLVALNVPFYIPPKISTGGIDSLSAQDRRYLPDKIDLHNRAHRAYLKRIFSFHHIKGRTSFEYFYEAQCVWEDAMAQAVADNLGQNSMVVLAGNGHIIHKFGIPERAFARTGAPFGTVYLAESGEHTDFSFADYIWLIRGATIKSEPVQQARASL